MTRYDITLKIVTPCITSGADQQRAEFRAPAIRGQLRHWFRVLGGSPQEEMQLFGGIHGDAENQTRASKVLVRVKTAANQIRPSKKDGQAICGNQGKQPDYFLWPLRKTNSDATAGLRGVVEPDQAVEIQIIDKSASQGFKRCMMAFLFLGAIGTRSRRGYGSVFPEAISCNGENIDLPKSLETFAAEVRSLNLPNVRLLAAKESCSTYKDAIRCCVDLLKAFRCGSEKSGRPSRWGLNDHDLVFKNSGKNYRAVIGLPMAQRYSNNRGTFNTRISHDDPVANNRNDRWASPVCFKVLPFGGSFYPLAIVLRDYVMPEGTRLNISSGKNNVRATASHELLNALMDPTQHGAVDQDGVWRVLE